MIAAYVARGYRVQSQDAWTAVMVKGHRVNHLLHLILTIVTGGLWLFVWVPVAMFGGERRTLLTMDGTGEMASTSFAPKAMDDSTDRPVTNGKSNITCGFWRLAAASAER